VNHCRNFRRSVKTVLAASAGVASIAASTSSSTAATPVRSSPAVDAPTPDDIGVIDGLFLDRRTAMNLDHGLAKYLPDAFGGVVTDEGRAEARVYVVGRADEATVETLRRAVSKVRDLQAASVVDEKGNPVPDDVKYPQLSVRVLG
jgi:hypothetical protein